MRTIHAVIPAMCLLVSLQSGSQIADPQAEIIEVPAGDRFLRWQAKAGHTYFIQTSDPNTHLENWIWTPCIESRAVDIAITYEIGTTAEKAFFRIHHTEQSPPPGVSLEDWDADGDGLSNAFELSIQTNPLNPDTSGDGIPDGWAFVHGLNPLLDNSGGFFQSTETTNLAAYQAGVQANPNATLADHDGDFRNNEDDVDPNDADLNWLRAGEASYVLIDLDVPSTAGQARDINDKGEVLFDTGIWSGGEWIPIDAEPYQGIRPGPGENNDSNYEVNASNWMFFNDAGQLTGYATLDVLTGPHNGDVPTVLQWTPGDTYSRHAPSAIPFFDYNDGEASPIGISDNGTVFSRFAYPALGGPESVPTARILVTAANGTHQSLLSGADGWHPIGSHAHSDVSGNGWLVANTASTLNGAADYRLSLWNPSQTLVSLPAQANGFFYPLHLADLDEGQLLIAAGTQSEIGSEVFLNESGTARHLPSLSGKKIRLFAGDGTGMTSDGQLWRNGELIPMRDLCQQWDELMDGGWNLEALKANTFGMYLIQATHPQEPEPRSFLLPPVEIIIPRLNSNGNQIGDEYVIAEKLKVAKWENAFEGAGVDGAVKDDFIGWDPDRFYVRIRGGANIGVEAITVATENCPDDSYNDDPTRVEMTASDLDSFSDSMILVSDDEDDIFPGSGAGADDQDNDRTHKVQLGGNFVIKSIFIKSIEHSANIKIPVPALKQVDIIFCRFQFSGAATEQSIRDSIKWVKERYAQVGLRINDIYTEVEWPNINGTEGVGKMSIYGNFSVDPTLRQVYYDFIDNVPRSGVCVYNVIYAYPSAGIAVSMKQASLEAAIELKYLNKAFVHSTPHPITGVATASAETTAHEILHVLAPKFSGNDHDEEYPNILVTPGQNIHDDHRGRKRINSEQEARIYNHVNVEDIE